MENENSIQYMTHHLGWIKAQMAIIIVIMLYVAISNPASQCGEQVTPPENFVRPPPVTVTGLTLKNVRIKNQIYADFEFKGDFKAGNTYAVFHNRQFLGEGTSQDGKLVIENDYLQQDLTGNDYRLFDIAEKGHFFYNYDKHPDLGQLKTAFTLADPRSKSVINVKVK